MSDLISRQAAIDAIGKASDELYENIKKGATFPQRHWFDGIAQAQSILENLPSTQPTIYGYNVEHLKLIARILQKENVPPERVVEALTDIGRIVAIINDEFEESLRRELNNVRFNRETSSD